MEQEKNDPGFLSTVWGSFKQGVSEGNKQYKRNANEKQARKEKPYEYKTVRRNKETQKLLEKGWELVDSSGKESVWSGSYKAIMRRPNPRYKG